MPVASYQSPNNYDLVKDIRPFDLPYQATMNEISAKSQYWRINADRVKSVYEQAAGLDPQFAQNKEYLKNYMEQANKNLAKITKSDISISDNYQQAIDVFKPLYDTSNQFNKRLLADSQINKFYKEQALLSENYRTKDGGKEWNQNNDFYYKDSYQKYLNDAKIGNVDSIENHFQNRKGFIPYYDYKKEILDIQEACKGQSYSEKGVLKGNDQYFREISKKGCSPEELSLAFKTGLSDKARQQINIDGYVHFRGNEDVLVREFEDKMINIPQNKVNALKATIAGIKEGGISANEVERLKFYEDKLALLEPELKQSKEDFSAMTKGNTLEYIKNNYDKLSGQIYFGDLTNQLGVAYRTDDNKDLLSTNAAGMLRLRLETDRANMYIQDNFDKTNDYRNHMYRLDEIAAQSQNALELARLKGEIVGGVRNIAPNPAFPVTNDNINISDTTEQDFINENLTPAIKEADNAYQVLNTYINNALGKEHFADGSQRNTRTHEEISNYITELENKQKKGEPLTDQALNILKAFDRYKNAKDNLAFTNDQIESVNNNIKNTNPELFDNSNFDTKQITFNDVVSLFDNKPVKNLPTLSEQEMVRLLKGETIKGYRYIQGTLNKDGILGVESFQKIRYKDQDLNIINTSSLGNLVFKARQKDMDNIDKINDLKTQQYTKNYYENSPYTTFNLAAFGKKEFWEANYESKLKQVLNAPGGLGQKNGFEILFRDKTGEGAYVRLLDENAFSIVPDTKGEDETLARLKESEFGYGADKKKVGRAYAYYIPNIFPRYEGLPNAEKLSKYDKIKNHMLYMENNILSNPQLANQPVIESKDLLTGGTSRYVADTGIEYIISFRKEAGLPITYVATYTTPKGEVREQQAGSIDQLLPKLDITK